jgi:hypothetical protein
MAQGFGLVWFGLEKNAETEIEKREMTSSC